MTWKKGFHKYSMKILLRWWSEEKQLCSSYEVQLFRNVMQVMYNRVKGVTECKDDFLDVTFRIFNYCYFLLYKILRDFEL